MEAAINRGQCDAVSAGRPFIADPYFTCTYAKMSPGPRCVDCNACVGRIWGATCRLLSPYREGRKGRHAGKACVKLSTAAMLASLLSRPVG